MIIVRVARSERNIMVVKLPHANMKVDPRIICWWRNYKFSLSVNGRTLTVTRTDEYGGWPGFKLRVYMPGEDIPDFTSTVYTYHGLDHERAPSDTTEVILHPSVIVIKEDAFWNCKSLVRVAITDAITRIEYRAFKGCDSLRCILLSRNLESIGTEAFQDCESLQSVFLPPTVTHIADRAFADCKSLRCLYVPALLEHNGIHVVSGCERLLTTVNYEFVVNENYKDTINNDEVNAWLMQRYANLPFHQACSSISITPQVIVHGIERAMEIDEYQMTALHIICANPHITADAIRAYLQLAPEAADQEDSEGMTPFQYLCRNGITFLEDRNFSSLMAWWYGCMVPPQTETGNESVNDVTEYI